MLEKVERLHRAVIKECVAVLELRYFSLSFLLNTPSKKVSWLCVQSSVYLLTPLYGRHEIPLWKRPDRSQKDEEWKLTYLNYPVEKTRQKISDTHFGFGNLPTEKSRQCQNWSLFIFCIDRKK